MTLYHSDFTRAFVAALAVAGLSMASAPGFAGPPVTGPGCGPDASCPSIPSSGKVDPKFEFLRHTLQTMGPDAAVFGPEGLPDDADLTGVGATLRFRRLLSVAEVNALSEAGVRFTRDEGKLVRVGTIYSAFVRFEALDRLASHPELLRVEAAWRPVTPPPLEVTSELVGAAQARMLPDLGVDGSDVVIGDLDGGVDPLHPHLFKPDGGYYDWVDDGDGEFRAGQDGVDLDGDGEVGNDEFLRVLDATIVDRQGLKNDDGVFQTDVDWVYVDVNNDGERNVGADQGFTEDDPAYGEPLFVADDVDGDGTLEPGEKLVRLGTSKIRKYVLADRTYVRGEDLIEGALDEAAQYAGHGTSVSSILVGGAARYQQRVGLAPAAEIVMFSSSYSGSQGQWPEDSPQLGDIRTALDDGVNVLLHEWTDPYSAPHDGSGNVEAAMDEARAEGVVQVNPLGNLNLAQKHVERDVEAGATTELGFGVDEGFQWGNQLVPYSVVYATIFWDSAAEPTFTVVAPDGTEVAVQYDQQVSVGPDVLWGSYEETSRGSRQATLYLYSQDQQSSLVQGDWKIRVEGVDEATHLIGRITDYYSSWSPGVGWDGYQEGVHTLVYPSTADSAVGVAAYGGRHDQSWDGSRVGQLRGFSGRGPRFDGAHAVDIAAPDDPYAAMAATPRVVEAGYGRSWFSTFGGTSGAGPHVAASFALLASQNPMASPDELETALFDAADRAALSPEVDEFPNPLWGYGKVDAYEALFGMEVYGVNERPAANLEVRVDELVRFDASNSNDPDGDSMQYRFDFDYDGTWDTEWRDEAIAIQGRDTLDGPGTYRARVDVRDAVGAHRGALADYELLETSEPDPDPDEMQTEEPEPDVELVDDQRADQVNDEPKDRGCGGCASTPDGSPDAALLFIVVALIGLRRRRGSEVTSARPSRRGGRRRAG